MHYTYILRSLKTDGALYVGSTSDLKRRLSEHNSGKSIYTNKHRPWQIETYIAFATALEAEAFERYLKFNSGKAFLLKRLVSEKLRESRLLYKNGRVKGVEK